MSGVSRNENAYTVQEENSTTYPATMKKKKAAYHKIRGLRRCQNAECGVHLASRSERCLEHCRKLPSSLRGETHAVGPISSQIEIVFYSSTNFNIVCTK